MTFFHPGSVLIPDPQIFGKKNSRQMAGKDRQNGDKRNDFLLHRFFKKHDIIDEQPQKKMPCKD